MKVSPVSINEVRSYTNFKQNLNTTYLSKEVDLPSQVDAKNFVNVNFKANTQTFDTFIKRFVPSELSSQKLSEIPWIKTSNISKTLKNMVVKPLQNSKEIPMGFIFYGKPGTGKTAVAIALAKETKLPLYKLDINGVTGFNPEKLSYESLENIEKIFQQLNQKYRKTGEPSILHIEDADNLFYELDREGILSDVVYLLNNSKNMGIIPIIEPAKMLPSYVARLLPRFNNLQFLNPNLEGRKAIIKDSLAPRKRAEALLKNRMAIKEIAEKTENMSPRKLYSIINNAAFNARYDGLRDIQKDDILRLIY